MIAHGARNGREPPMHPAVAPRRVSSRGAGSRGRTGTALAHRGILSPLRLPIPPCPLDPAGSNTQVLPRGLELALVVARAGGSSLSEPAAQGKASIRTSGPALGILNPRGLFIRHVCFAFLSPAPVLRGCRAARGWLRVVRLRQRERDDRSGL